MKGEKIMAILGIGNKPVDYTGKDVKIVSYLAGVAWEIAEHKREEEALRESEERISAITNSANEAITMMDDQGNITYWNPAAQRILGYTKEEAIGKNLHELIAPERFRPAHLAAFPEFQKTGQGNAIGKTLELAARRKDGHEIEVALSLSAVKIKQEWHSVGIIQDITERKKAEEKIQYLATHDLLTDLPSMGLARDRLSLALDMARRYKKAVALMFVDLDGFKDVNDSLGHHAGDYVLKQVAQRLLSCVRETDTVARFGGDEFLIIATEINAPENAAQIAEKVIQLVSQPVIFNGQQVVVGTSIGIALFPDHGEDMDQLIKQADEAMYRVKNAGKNGFRFVNSALI
jgi:diguanylate cyclase (GGDEF)-like protein/PAS domain S-box-containing protein